MDSLIGILLDVSGSMKESVGDRQNRSGKEWARANFDLVHNLIKHDVSSNNHVFALGFGGSYEPATFDLLNTIQKANTPSVSDNLTLEQTLDRILSILETNGAPRVRIWGKMSVLLSVVNEIDAKLFLDKLSDSSYFRKRFVYDCLPKECRRVTVSVNEAGYGVLRGIGCVGRLLGICSTETLEEAATGDSVMKVIEKGKALLAETTFVRIGKTAVMDVQEAMGILLDRFKKDDLTDERVDELMCKIRPFIYGRTPLIATLQRAERLFAIKRFKKFNKLLFILSDGQPTDSGSEPIKQLEKLGVKTVSCFITANSIKDPKRLYAGDRTPFSDDGANFMFRISSKISTQLIPRTIFVKRGWKIDIKTNETRLFLQVNHPDILEDACDLARDVVCSQDALSDALSSIDLDLYINKANQGFVPKEQVGGTCYANATAAVLHLAMKRIIEREGGVPDFFQLRDKLIHKYGKHGANTFKVVQEVCPKYRLQCKEVDIRGALKAITEKRPVVAKFRLTDKEWDKFSLFYRNHPLGILSKTDLRINRPTTLKLSGHAVVLTSFDSQGLRLMNSWGDTWADGGFFRIRDVEVLDLEFVDVYWTSSNLKRSEKKAYNEHGAYVASNLISRLQGLQKARHVCPKCNQASCLGEFTGHALETTCPKCSGRFRIENTGSDLALNLYLLSLSTASTEAKRIENQHDAGIHSNKVSASEAVQSLSGSPDPESIHQTEPLPIQHAKVHGGAFGERYRAFRRMPNHEPDQQNKPVPVYRERTRGMTFGEQDRASYFRRMPNHEPEQKNESVPVYRERARGTAFGEQDRASYSRRMPNHEPDQQNEPVPVYREPSRDWALSRASYSRLMPNHEPDQQNEPVSMYPSRAHRMTFGERNRASYSRWMFNHEPL